MIPSVIPSLRYLVFESFVSFASGSTAIESIVFERVERLFVRFAKRFSFGIDALLPIARSVSARSRADWKRDDGVFSTQPRSEEHTSELQPRVDISYAVF